MTGSGNGIRKQSVSSSKTLLEYRVLLLILLILAVASLSGNGVAHINEVTRLRAWLVLEWVTVSGTFIWVYDHPPRSI